MAVEEQEGRVGGRGDNVMVVIMTNLLSYVAIFAISEKAIGFLQWIRQLLKITDLIREYLRAPFSDDCRCCPEGLGSVVGHPDLGGLLVLD